LARNLNADDVPEDWKYDLLDNLAHRCSGHTPSKSHSSYWNGGVKWISLSDSFRLDKGYVYVTDKQISHDGLKNSSAELHPAGTVVLVRDAGIGKSGVMAESMAVSQHFIAWKCDNREKMYNWFLYNWLQFYKKEFERQAVGSTIKTIGLPFFKKLKIAAPPLPEQRKIAKILQTWDRAIATTEKLIDASKQQKKALMQQLLTGKKRFVGFEGEWSRIELNELLDYTQPTAFIVQSTRYDDKFETPVLTAGKTFILGYTNENSGIYKDGLPAIIFDDFTTASQYVDFSFKVKSSAMKILTSKYDYPLRFVFESMQRLDFSVGGHQRHWISIFSRLVISVPDKTEAQQISTVLKTVNIEISNLRKKLDALKLEKKALMQQLLTGNRRVKIDE